ncbi:MAG: hypothetical protein QF613_01340 [Candidatus Marinimicrobia bacterium]|nr:hypothetical protein [Candidatus Neomarinimicrobiota bacterium]MDP6592839.1 hypothetical protein [Candidatus Neomarinimicrobiota bacterium]MDP6835860.1 hypothetical protein [Candidatus Neomarinimicrobiota bacterium]
MDLQNIEELEIYFANHFDTWLFPVLAEHYLTEGDHERAHKVSEIGLSRHPDHVPGLFVEARIQMAEGKLKNAEKLLKKTVSLDPGHFNAYILLAQVQADLGRSAKTVRKLYETILEMDSTNEKAKAWLAKPSDAGKRSRKKVTAPAKRAPKGRVKKPRERPPRESLADFPITPQVATFTLMAVLKSQKLYRQALEVLTVMSGKKDADIERIAKEKSDLMRLLKSQSGIR